MRNSPLRSGLSVSPVENDETVRTGCRCRAARTWPSSPRGAPASVWAATHAPLPSTTQWPTSLALTHSALRPRSAQHSLLFLVDDLLRHED